VSDPFLGEIRMFGFNFAPRGWAFCAGQVLSIAQNTALFALIGTFYGGDGISTFALPDLRSRVGINQGQGAGLSPYVIGESGGLENVTLSTQQLPQHNHPLQVNNSPAAGDKPAGNVLARTGSPAYASSTDGTAMNASMNPFTGGGQPHPNIQPFLALNFCIALQGIFPSRN
jgi:microcystin-dependent protein